MGQEPEQIERHIYQTRARLEENVEELRTRVRSNLDWRNHFRRHPAAFSGAAFAVGLSAALLVGRALESARLRRRALNGTLLGELASGRRDLRSERARPSWDEIIDTLAALGPAQTRALFGQLLPALRQYLARR